MAHTKSRTIAKVVSAIPGTPSRLVGTVDIDGNGRTHELHQVDPFILLDQATIPKNGKPPFGSHPHRGHSVVTVLFNGKVKAWDSFSNEHYHFSAPASCLVEAGSGLFHDETSVVEDESDFSQRMSLLQLWIGVREADRSLPAKLHMDTDLPVEEIYGTVNDAGNNNNNNNNNGSDPKIGFVRYHLGPKTTISSLHPLTVAYVHQDAGTTFRFPVDPTHGGMVVNLNGSDMLDESGPESSSPSFAGTRPSKTNDVLVLSNDDGDGAGYLEVTTPADACGDYMVCVGERIQEPWCKKLVSNGAVIASSEDEARSLASNVEKLVSENNYAPFGDPTK